MFGLSATGEEGLAADQSREKERGRERERGREGGGGDRGRMAREQRVRKGTSKGDDQKKEKQRHRRTRCWREAGKQEQTLVRENGTKRNHRGRGTQRGVV